MKGIITLERKSKDGRLLERRVLPMRSFTRGFIDQLYILHAQIASGAPFVDLNHIDGRYSSMYCRVDNYNTPNFITASPPGDVPIVNPATTTTEILPTIPGSLVGILVGVGNTAATPLDTELVSQIGHGVRPPDGGSVLMDSYALGEDGEDSLNQNTWSCQPFLCRTTHAAQSASIKVWRVGACGDITLTIRPVANEIDGQPLCLDANEIVTGTILQASIGLVSPGALQNAVWGTPRTLHAGRLYALVARVPNAVDCRWRKDDSTSLYINSPMNKYADEGCFRSGNAGATWDNVDQWHNKTFMFELYGQSVGEFIASGTVFGDFTVADPNVSFTIKRFFSNKCGAAITVNEVGLSSLVPNYRWTNDRTIAPLLIARDVVGPGVAVADTEILEVTYTVSITV